MKKFNADETKSNIIKSALYFLCGGYGFFYRNGKLVGARRLFVSAFYAFEIFDNIFGFHAQGKLCNTLCVAAASAFKLNVCHDSFFYGKVNRA
jgi:hypothetical protein